MKKENKELINNLKNNKDIKIIENKYKDLIMIYQEELCDYKTFLKFFFPKIDKMALDEEFPGIAKEVDLGYEDIIQAIFSGLMVVIKNKKTYLFDLVNQPIRSVGDPNSEPESMFDSRDGFIESYKKNIALLRTRIKSDNLLINEYMIGRRSKTAVGVLYIDDIHNKLFIKKIDRILKRIDVDAILSIEDLTCFFQHNHIFPIYQYIGSPDLASRKFYDGEIIIVIDKIPTVIVIPTTFSLSTRFRFDNLNLPGSAVFERLFILFALFISTVFLALVVCFSTFQSDSLSLMLINILSDTRKDVFLPIFVEVLVTLGLFELCYLIGYRQSKMTISFSVVVITGLIIGENMISSGMAGVLLMSLSALAFLNSFVVSSNVTMTYSISIIRIYLLLCSFLFGIYGLSIGLFYLLYLLYKNTTLGVPFFYPFMPFNFKDFINFFKATSEKKNRVTSMQVIDKRGKK